ncbi:glycerol-3-phosphate acyltransferase [Priestia taiwanensis]|uniref:glycerol-3-phosphate acyltransferase n=1 Tax=Priestia taiwanensis TaxID=1347902 RepID=UPI00227CD1B8|nr:glycerol-3-phosphate acyltransferase [Priestia taiwanensis]
MGNFLFAYLIAKCLRGTDIRAEGSTNPGARNIGTLYGKPFFIATFLGDAGKGALVVYIATVMTELHPYALIGFLAVIIGHLYPIFFRLKGGKGLSTFAGGLLVIEPLLLLALLAIAGILSLFIRSFTVGGMIGVAVAPIGLYFFTHSYMDMFVMGICSLLIIFSHRTNIVRSLKKEEKLHEFSL